MDKENQEMTQAFEAEAQSCCSTSSCCAPQTPIVNSSEKIGRNDPCPCDSGRKFKKCCG